MPVSVVNYAQKLKNNSDFRLSRELFYANFKKASQNKELKV